MKKKKVLMATLAAATIALGCGAFAACGHEHTYSDKWDNDATGHWHAATCDDLKKGDEGYAGDFAAHDFGDDEICDTCNYDGHIHSYTKWDKTDVEHWKYCEKDNEIDATTKTAHDYTNGDCECGKEKPTVSLDKEELKLDITTTTAKLTATVTGGTLEWSSSDESVVLVDKDGNVEALKPGKATITATVKSTQISESCEVTVDKAYYIIGGMDAAWDKVGVFGQDNVIYFMPTDTEGVYETRSFELRYKGKFQVAEVGYTSADNADPNVWWKHALNGSYVAENDTVLYNRGDIVVGERAMYKVKLDLTGENPVISGQKTGELDQLPLDYYLVGGINNWTTADTTQAAGDYLFTNNNDGTYTLEVELAKDIEFKAAVVGGGWNGEINKNHVAKGRIKNNVSKDVKLVFGNGENMKAGVAGKYTFTITAGIDDVINYTFEATAATVEPDYPDALYYYIKGTAVEGGWDASATEVNELKETGTGTDVFKGTFHLTAGGEFMFYSYAKFDGTVKEEQYDYYNNGNSSFTAGKYTTEGGEEAVCVTAPGTNYVAAVDGWYTVTIDRDANTLTFTYSATNPADAD